MGQRQAAGYRRTTEEGKPIVEGASIIGPKKAVRAEPTRCEERNVERLGENWQPGGLL